MSESSSLSAFLAEVARELAERTGLPLPRVMETTKRYLYELLKESQILKRELLALLEIERRFNKRFRVAKSVREYDFISEDEGIVVKIVDELTSYDEYAERCVKELAELFRMMRRGVRVYLLSWKRSEQEFELFELNNILSRLSQHILDRIVELSGERVSIGRKPTRIPLELVQEKLKEGWSFRRIYRFLIEKGYLKYTEKGKEKILTYKQFCYRLNRLGIYRTPKGEKHMTVPRILYERDKLLKAYEEFRKVTDEKDWKNIPLFMNFLIGKGFISGERVSKSLIYRRLAVILEGGILENSEEY